MPRYCGGDVGTGWDALCASLPEAGAVVAADGPAILDWDALVAGVRAALRRRGIALELIDLRELTVPWEQVVSRTAPVERLREDPDFATLARGEISDLFDRLPATRTRTCGLVLVAGPGAALTDHDVLWYADLPKRHAESAVTAGRGRNLGQRGGAGPPSARRLFYLDWPLQDRHRDRLGPRIE